MRDEPAKAELLTAWLARHRDRTVRLAQLGGLIDQTAVLKTIHGIVGSPDAEEWLYVMLAAEEPAVSRNRR